MKYLQLNKFLTSLVILMSSMYCMGQEFPSSGEERAKYNFSIELKKVHISGILIILKEEKCIKASVINEFGVSALDFIYSPENKSVTIENILNKIDRWYIRKVLKKDLVQVINAIKRNEESFENKKNKIKYIFTPLCS